MTTTLEKPPHRTQTIAEEVLIIFEKNRLDLAEGYMVIAIILKCLGLAMNFGPKKTLSMLQRVMIRLAQLSKSRDVQDKIWVPKGIGLE